LKALIVDDEVDICYLLSSILKQQQLKTSYVHTLAAAKTALHADAPAILFLDNHLPDGRGLDFIAEIKKNWPATKVIMITAHDSPNERRQAREEGADLFISKPFSREVILDALRSLSAVL
jgi:DNA-binding response OmpR family regulator